MMYFGGADQAENGDYSVLDDGRLNLSLGGQVNNFFVPTLGNDQLQLKDPDSGKVMQYRRLKIGETMATALVEQDNSQKQAVQNRNDALPNFLARKDLVMVLINPPANAPAPCAIQWGPTSQTDYSGRAYFDSKPPHVEIIAAQIQPTGSDGSARVAISFGPGNGQQTGGQGTWMFHVVQTGADISLTSEVSFGEMFNTDATTTVIVKSDPAMYKQITGAIQDEAARLEKLKAPVVAMLKDYVVLKGVSQSTNPNDHGGSIDQFTLARRGNSWAGEGQSTNRGTGATEIFPIMASVGMLGGKPAIQVVSQKRVYQFTDIDTTTGKLTGMWAVPQSTTGHTSDFSIVQAVDSQARDQLFATRKASLQKLGGSTVFHAVLGDQYSNSQPPNPISVTLSLDDKNAVTGKVDYAMEGCTLNLTGKEVDTPFGPKLIVQYTAGQPDADACNDAKAFMDALQHEVWTLQAAEDSSGSLQLEGYAVVRPGQNAIPITLQLTAFGDKEKADLIKSVSDGIRVKVTTPQMGNDPDTILTFSTGADGKLTGQITAGGTHINSRLNQKFTGEIKDKDGWTELNLLQDNNGRKPNFGWVMLVSPTDNGIYLNASTYSTNVGGQTRPLGHWDAMQVK